MDLGSVRDLALSVNFSAHGVPATVTRPLENAITTRIIWITPISDDVPSGLDLRRNEPQRIAALRRDEVPTVPRLTVIEAPEKAGGAVERWLVDGTERTEADHVRVMVRREGVAC